MTDLPFFYRFPKVLRRGSLLSFRRPRRNMISCLPYRQARIPPCLIKEMALRSSLARIDKCWDFKTRLYHFNVMFVSLFIVLCFVESCLYLYFVMFHCSYLWDDCTSHVKQMTEELIWGLLLEKFNSQVWEELLSLALTKSTL